MIANRSSHDLFVYASFMLWSLDVKKHGSAERDAEHERNGPIK
jgi:hypothetical protein